MLDPVLRRLARDQWVRLHGTPRVTVLVGGARGRDIWYRWLALSAVVGTLLETAPARGSNGASVDEQIRAAVERAVAEPGHPIAVLTSAEAVAGWRAGRRDRLAAMVDEGWIDVPDEAAPAHAVSAAARPVQRSASSSSSSSAGGGGASSGSSAGGGGASGASGGGGGAHADPGGTAELRAAGLAATIDARSLAEATLFEALEATPATAGRFQLNESLSVRFGPTAAEIDLLSRGDRIAIEIDGIHHFADPDCYRRDRRKDLLLQTQGFVVVRLLAEDVVRDARAAVTAVCQALAYRRGEAGE